MQDLNYWYDPVGNITRRTDGATQELYYNVTGASINVASPDNDYTYDALYRLVLASGREQGATSNSTVYPSTNDDQWFDIQPLQIDCNHISLFYPKFYTDEILYRNY